MTFRESIKFRSARTLALVHANCWVLKMNPPRLPYHLSNDIVRRGGVLWVEFWEAANGTSVGWNHLRRWLRNPNEKEIIDCKRAHVKVKHT